jgi:hypothetical protein
LCSHIFVKQYFLGITHGIKTMSNSLTDAELDIDDFCENPHDAFAAYVALKKQCELMKLDAAVGAVVWEHIDAMGDLDDMHTAEYELNRFMVAVRPTIDAALEVLCPPRSSPGKSES